MYGGDFNARTGSKGAKISNILKEENRKSKDKTINKEREELNQWLRSNGLIIINGIKEDDQEYYTYTGGAGFSVIEYILANEEDEEEIKNMSTEKRIYSDQQPLLIKLKECIEQSKEIEWKKFKNWSTKGIKIYQDKLKEMVEARSWRELKEKIRDATLIEEKKL